MKYNKIIKENDYNKNSFLITTISCVILLLALCYFGINSGVKGTYSASSCPSTAPKEIDGKCCPNSADDIVNGYCVSSSKNPIYNSLYGYICKTTEQSVSDIATFSCSTGYTAHCVKDTIGNSGKCYCYQKLDSCGVKAVNKEESIDYNNTYACWFCNGTYKFQIGQNGCQYPITSLSDVNKDGQVNNYDCEAMNKKTYTVLYDANGGSDAPASQTKKEGESLIISPTVLPKRSGYTFTKWNTKSDGSGTSYSAGTTYSKDESVILYAQWEKDSPSYTITFNTHGGDAVNSISGKKSEPIELPTPSKNGCDFDAWYTSITNGTIAGKAGDPYIITGNATLHAVWTNCQNPSTPKPTPDPTPTPDPDPTPTPEPEPSENKFTATFDPNGGSLVGDSTKSCSDSSPSCIITSLPSANRDGYTFNGWGAIKTCTSGNKSSISLSSNETYYACWLGSGGDNPDEDTDYTGDDVHENPPTGQTTLIAVIWFLGLMAIGYAFYYFKSAREN